MVEDGYMSIAWSDEPVEEPEWDDVEKNAFKVIGSYDGRRPR